MILMSFCQSYHISIYVSNHRLAVCIVIKLLCFLIYIPCIVCIFTLFVCAVAQNIATTNLISNDATIGHDTLNDTEFDIIADAAFSERKLLIITCITLTIILTI